RIAADPSMPDARRRTVATGSAMRAGSLSRYPSASDKPIVTFWSPAPLGGDWKPPACTSWTAEGFSTLVTTVARFHGPAETEDMLRRIGAISQLTGMRYCRGLWIEIECRGQECGVERSSRCPREH